MQCTENRREQGQAAAARKPASFLDFVSRGRRETCESTSSRRALGGGSKKGDARCEGMPNTVSHRAARIRNGDAFVANTDKFHQRGGKRNSRCNASGVLLVGQLFNLAECLQSARWTAAFGPAGVR
jgi:hypothetical protein